MTVCLQYTVKITQERTSYLFISIFPETTGLKGADVRMKRQQNLEGLDCDESEEGETIKIA